MSRWRVFALTPSVVANMPPATWTVHIDADATWVTNAGALIFGKRTTAPTERAANNSEEMLETHIFAPGTWIRVERLMS